MLVKLTQANVKIINCNQASGFLIEKFLSNTEITVKLGYNEHSGTIK